MNCKNCGYAINGNYCSQCGQDSSIGRINLPNFIHELSESIFQIDKGLFFTIKELFLRPGESLNEFINGKRKNHFKPIAYVLTLSAVYFVITQITHQNTWIDDLLSGWLNGAKEQNVKNEEPIIITWFSKNYAYSTLLLLPLFSLASYLSFFKFDKNYLEHIVINSYITGQQAILYAIFAIMGSFLKNDLVEISSLIVSISYAFWVLWHFFSPTKLMNTILRLFLTYTLYFIFSLVLLFATMGFYTLLR